MGSSIKRGLDGARLNGAANDPDQVGSIGSPAPAAGPMSGGMRTLTRTLSVSSDRHTDFVDVTDDVARVVAESGVTDGFALIFSQHTTARIHVNEHEPLLLADLTTLLEHLVPRDAFYRHDDFSVRTVNVTPGERINGHSHCRGLFAPVSEHLPVSGGLLMLGRWQRVFMVELDGPQVRQVVVKVMGI